MPLLSMHPSMHEGDGSKLPTDQPIQYKVDGLLGGIEALIDKDYATNPPTWKITLRMGPDRVWVDVGTGHYESPAEALAVLQAAFSS